MVQCLITHRDTFTFTSYPVNHNNDQEFGTACYYILDCLVTPPWTPFGFLLQRGRKTREGQNQKQKNHINPKRWWRKAKITLEQATNIYSFFNLGARWDGWSMPHPGGFTCGKETQYPLYSRLGGPQGQSGWMRISCPPPRVNPRTVQPVVSRYVNYAISTHQQVGTEHKCWKVKVNQSLYKPELALKVPGGSDSQISRQLAYEGGKVVSPMH